MSMKIFAIFCSFLLITLEPINAAEENILVTSVSGKISRLSDGQAVHVFAYLGAGDRLDFTPGSRLRLLFGKSGRQETWSGQGQMEISSNSGHSSNLPAAQVSTLPNPVVSQIMKTPTVNAQGDVRIARSRSIPTPDALNRLEKEYWRLRTDAISGDLNPELFLLSGLLEMRETKRLEEVLALMPTLYPDNTEAKIIISLYKKSLKSLR